MSEETNQFAVNFNNEDGGIQTPTPAEVDNIEEVELVEFIPETTDNENN